MKFGKLEDITKVDFTLAATPMSSQAHIERFQLKSAKERSSIFIGATGWGMPIWKGKWYPKKAKTTDFLQHYSQQFNTIELNTTHYRIPSPDLVHKWYTETPKDFRFCPKIPQVISHVNNLDIGGERTKRFIDNIEGLKEKYGCAFIQLPPHFDSKRIDLLDQFLGYWPKLLPIAVEVRHPSWFYNSSNTALLMDCLAKHHAAAVITDVAGRRDVLHMHITAPHCMVRFVGNSLHESDYSRLQSWIKRLGSWQLPTNYFFPHQPDNILAPDAAAWMSQQLQQTDWASTRGPIRIPDDPIQGVLF